MSERQFHWQSSSRQGPAVDGCARLLTSKDRGGFGWPWLFNRASLMVGQLSLVMKC